MDKLSVNPGLAGMKPLSLTQMETLNGGGICSTLLIGAIQLILIGQIGSAQVVLEVYNFLCAE